MLITLKVSPVYISDVWILEKQAGPEVIKTFSMLSSTEHGISNAHKFKYIKKFSLFVAQISLDRYFSCS